LAPKELDLLTFCKGHRLFTPTTLQAPFTMENVFGASTSSLFFESDVESAFYRTSPEDRVEQSPESRLNDNDESSDSDSDKKSPYQPYIVVGSLVSALSIICAVILLALSLS